MERPNILNTEANVNLLRNSSNLGFAKANNRGIRAADPAHDTVLLDNDTIIEQPDWLLQMHDCAYSSPEVGVVGCRLTNLGGTFQHVYLPLDHLRGIQIGGGGGDIGQYGGNREVECCLRMCLPQAGCDRASRTPG
jgi:GT2 family glycosyltransferase